jgi:hypothetical protein
MGALLTRPLREYSSLELSTAVEEHFGSHYAEYARSMRENGVDGALLEGMDEAQIVETFQDLGIDNRLHCRVLMKEFKASLERSERLSLSSRRTSFEAAAEYDLHSGTCSSELKPFDDINGE